MIYPSRAFRAVFSLPLVAAQCILLDRLTGTVVGGRKPLQAQRLVCFVSAETLATDESPTRRRLRADRVVLEHLERCFDSVHPRRVPALLRVQWSKLLRADASRQQRNGHRTLHDAILLLPQRLGQQAEMQPGCTTKAR